MNKQKRGKEKELRQQLSTLLLEESANTGEFKQEINDTKNKLEVIDSDHYKEAIVRARADKLWFGEMPTKRAFTDEKSYAQKNEFRKIQYKNVLTAPQK